jgi:hypothetical protein
MDILYGINLLHARIKGNSKKMLYLDLYVCVYIYFFQGLKTIVMEELVSRNMDKMDL